MRWDSNPRDARTPYKLLTCCFQPLSHSSLSRGVVGFHIVTNSAMVLLRPVDNYRAATTPAIR